MWYYTPPGTTVQVPLGVGDPLDRAGAEAALVKWLASEAGDGRQETGNRRQTDGPSGSGVSCPPSPVRSVSHAAADFLRHCDRKAAAGRLEAGTLAGYRIALAHLCGALGTSAVDSLSADDLLDWAAAGGWASSTQHNYLGVVQTLLRWCGVAVVISRPPRESRGADVVLTDEQFAAVLAELRRFPARKGDMAELLTVLRATGARPQEVARLTVDDVDWANSCTRLRKHKTRRKTGKDRVIHFNSAAMAVLNAQKARYGSGLLFRTRRGTPYAPTTISNRMLLVSKRLGFRAIAYCCRHGFATEALAAGVPDAIVAELLGHRGTSMLAHHYSHLGQRSAELKAAAERVAQKKPA